jgi:hypothetical protein
MKNDYLKFVTFLLLSNIYFTTSFAQTITTQTFSEGRVSYEWKAERRGAFHLSIDLATQAMIVIPLSPDFQGIKSLSIYKNRVGDSTNHIVDTLICKTEFIVPWHPDSRHEVPLPQDFLDCIGDVDAYSWQLVWMMEETEVILKELVLID